MSFITLLGGVSLAVIPAATVSIASRLFSVEEQGFLAVAVLVRHVRGPDDLRRSSWSRA